MKLSVLVELLKGPLFLSRNRDVDKRSKVGNKGCFGLSPAAQQVTLCGTLDAEKGSGVR